MVTVDYDHEIQYGHDPNGRPYPRLTVQVENPTAPDQALDIDAHLDSGAERSLFDGRLAPVLGLDLLSGAEVLLQSATGAALTARLHRIRVTHSTLGSFDLEAAFSTGDIGRNLLGRDFFARVQIGFRESHGAFYVTAQP